MRLTWCSLLVPFLIGWAAPALAIDISSLPFTASTDDSTYNVTGNLSGASGITVDCDSCTVNGHGYTLTVTSGGLVINDTTTGVYADSLTIDNDNGTSVVIGGQDTEVVAVLADGAGVSVRQCIDCTITDVDSNDPICGNGLSEVHECTGTTLTDCDWYSGTNASNGSSIRLQYSDQVTFTRCSFVCNSVVDNAVQTQFLTNSSFYDCTFYCDDAVSTEPALRLRNDSTGLYFDGCTINRKTAPTAAFALFIGQGAGAHFRNCAIYTAGIGLYFYIGVTTVTMEGCYLNGLQPIFSISSVSGGTLNLYGNTFFDDGTTVGSDGSHAAIYMPSDGNTIKMANNLFVTNSDYIYRFKGATSPDSCDYNAYYRVSGSGSMITSKGSTYSTFGDYQSGTGFDANGFYADPQTVDDIWSSVDSLANITPDTGSPLRDTGWYYPIVNASPTWIYDYYDSLRVANNVVDIGAAEFYVTDPTPTGACCFPDERATCQVTTETACTTVGGTFEGAGTTCDPDPCVGPTGACCATDGSCTLETQADCVGSWLGAGETCSPDPCPDPGACCLANGTCVESDEDVCADDGGTFQGAATTCTPDPCAAPTGACCTGGGSCSVADQATCEGAGSTYMGDGVPCSPDPCPAATGACCSNYYGSSTGGGCVIVAEAVCDTLSTLSGGFTYQGDATTCSPDPCNAYGVCCRPSGVCGIRTSVGCAALSGTTYLGDSTTCDGGGGTCLGACCLTDGTCSVISEDACTAISGAFEGHDTTCDPNPCAVTVGACCFSDGSCVVETSSDCTGDSGDYQGNGTTCDPGACLGACCFANGSCGVQPQSLCGTIGGTYSGHGTDCSPNPCDQPPTGSCCIGDLTTCVETDSVTCAVNLGDFTNGGDCTPNPCAADSTAGACCLPALLPPPGEDIQDAPCTIRTQSGCVSIGGTYQGDETDCDPTPCPVPNFGACCFGSGECTILPPGDCAGLAGSYQGDGEACSPNPCPAYFVNIVCGLVVAPRHNYLDSVSGEGGYVNHSDSTFVQLRGSGEAATVGHLTLASLNIADNAQILRAELLAHVVADYGDTVSVAFWDCPYATAEADGDFDTGPGFTRGSTWEYYSGGQGLEWSLAGAYDYGTDLSIPPIGGLVEFPQDENIVLLSGPGLVSWVQTYLVGTDAKRSLIFRPDDFVPANMDLRLEDFALRIEYECGGRRRTLMRWLWE